MKEQAVVNMVESQLKSRGRYFINCLGDGHGSSGKPDLVTLDNRGRLVGIECKRDGKEPVFTQLVSALDILKSGGRVAVAYSDFDLSELDAGTMLKVTLPEDYEVLINYKLVDKTKSFEFVLR